MTYCATSGSAIGRHCSKIWRSYPVAVSPAGRAAVRLGFPQECTTGDEVRKAMVALVADARAVAARREQ